MVFLKHVLWQSPEQQAEIGKALARISNPLNSKAVDYEDQAASAHLDNFPLSAPLFAGVMVRSAS